MKCLIAGIVLVFGSIASANPIVNGSFEEGLAGWHAYEQTIELWGMQIKVSHVSVGSGGTDGTQYAGLSAGAEAGGGVYHGSHASLDSDPFWANAGDMLSFDYRCGYSAEEMGSSHSSGFTLRNSTTGITSSFGLPETEQWSDFSHTIAEAGWHKLHFSVSAGSDIGSAGTSLGIDNVQLTMTTERTDFNQDGNVDLLDVNLLTAENNLSVGLAAPPADGKFDVNGDDIVNGADLDQWLIDAATINGYDSPYLKGDANLDGDVDVWVMDDSGDAQLLSENLGTMTGMVWGDGDFNGDGDVDVWAMDSLGDAQLLISNLGSSSDAAAGTAAAIYNAVTGDLTFDVGAGIGVIGVQAEGLNHGAVDAGSGLGAPAQNVDGILAYFSATGLAAGMADVGTVLPTGLTAEDIGFSYTPIGGGSTVVPVTVIVPEPSTIAMLLVLGAVALCWRRRAI